MSRLAGVKIRHYASVDAFEKEAQVFSVCHRDGKWVSFPRHLGFALWYPKACGHGNTPEEALDDLIKQCPGVVIDDRQSRA